MPTLGKPWAQPDAHAPLGSVRPKPVAHGPSWKMHLFGACPLRISSGAQVKATPGAAAYGACTTANIQGPCGGMAWLTCMPMRRQAVGLAGARAFRMRNAYRRTEELPVDQLAAVPQA